MSQIRTTRVKIKDINTEIARKARDAMGLGVTAGTKNSIKITGSKVPVWNNRPIELRPDKNGNAEFWVDLRSGNDGPEFDKFKNEFQCQYNKIKAEDKMEGWGWSSVDTEEDEEEILITLRKYV